MDFNCSKFYHLTVSELSYSRCDEKRDKLQEMPTRLVQFHENMTSALTWFTSLELDSAVDAAARDKQPDLTSLKEELKVRS